MFERTLYTYSMPQLPHVALNPTTGFATGLLLAFAILLAFELYSNRHQNKFSDEAKKKAAAETDAILEEARKQARKMIADAQTASLALTGTRQKEDETAEHAYEEALRQMLEKLQSQIQQGADVAVDVQKKMISMVGGELEKEAKQAQTLLAESVAKIEKGYEQQIAEQTKAAFDAAKSEAKAYEEARKAAVDAHIAALVQETMRLVLQQNLPKEIHADLIKTALEEAKASGVF